LKEYHLLRESSGQLVIKVRGWGVEMIVGIYLEKRVVGVTSKSAEGTGINTFPLSAGIEDNLLTMENES
jgi:ABC-type hemin transport system substrate-binding protein